MKLLHDGAGVAGVPEAVAVERRKGGERRTAASSPGYIVKRDEPLFLSSRRAESVATVVKIYMRPKGVQRRRSVEEIILTYD